MAVYAYEKNIASGMEYLPDSTALNLDDSSPELPDDGDTLSVSMICAVCGIPVGSVKERYEMSAQRGYYVCPRCKDT